jgi:hypothetical protein
VETVYKIDRASAALAATNACVKPLDTLRRRRSPRPRQNPGRRHARPARSRHDRRNRPGHRDGRRRSRHRQNHPPPPHARREHWHGSGDCAWVLYGRSACAEVSQARNLNKEPELATVGALCYACQARSRAITWRWNLSLHEHLWHASHRGGMAVMGTRVRVPKSIQTGIWRGKQHRTTRSINASTGE